MKHQTAAEFIKERAGENIMTKTERLELENAVLKNVIECSLEKIEIGKRIGKEAYMILAEIEVRLEYKRRIEFVMNHGFTNSLLSAKTVEDCQWEFERLENRIVLNDGMVMGTEY